MVRDLILFLKGIPSKFNLHDVVLSIAKNTDPPYAKTLANLGL
jgi:hypothetical protein